jgi:hypothetical protein
LESIHQEKSTEAAKLSDSQQDRSRNSALMVSCPRNHECNYAQQFSSSSGSCEMSKQECESQWLFLEQLCCEDENLGALSAICSLYKSIGNKKHEHASLMGNK